jgi:hypothetical protein
LAVVVTVYGIEVVYVAVEVQVIKSVVNEVSTLVSVISEVSIAVL